MVVWNDADLRPFYERLVANTSIKALMWLVESYRAMSIHQSDQVY